MSHEHQHQPQHERSSEQYGEMGMHDQHAGQRSGGGQMGGGRMMEGQQMGGQNPQTSGQQQQTGGGQRMGRPQMGGQSQGQRARSFEDHLTNELRIALEDFDETTHVASWCAKECAAEGPQLRTCVRICQDIAEIAELNEKLIARDSMFGPEVADLFIQVAMEGLPELRHHQQRHPHIAETVATIERTMNSCESVLEMVGQGGGQMPGGQPMGGRQSGGQQY